MDPNPDPRCSCIHSEAQHDPETGACLATNPYVGPCPCDATPEDVREQLWEDWDAASLHSSHSRGVG